jgi:tripeptidyl-peptidase-1
MSYLPQVTTVGGTVGANPEVGIHFSGGGWSNVFPVPDYQKDVVQSYIKGLNGNNTQLFNAVSDILSA